MESYPQYYDLVSRRYSCRKYADTPVTRDLIMAVLDTARLAPSACNKQPWVFLVADRHDPSHADLCAAIAKSYDREWLSKAPAYIIACGNHDEAWHRGCDGKDHTDVDLSIAIEHICLGAASIGLQTCWVCNFDPSPVREAFGLPDHIEPVAIVPIGHPAVEGSKPKVRKAIDEIVRWGKF